ncbi:AAA family ATPase [Trinickia fusca]|uniref:ATP-binding protein n=1 Tax=Trinickia fusca TaxID=2419777 RepID=A0A494WY47_9BURK|nr:AAA family ATPase [Trinickia fusca]RKP43477.1 ATP-binding protein [Trinickia fusca]
MSFTYHRTELAAGMARQLLHPGPLEQTLQSGLFLSGPRRVGKTTFLKFDLIPELEKQGAIVMYVDLWAQPQANPADLVAGEISKTLKDLSAPHSTILSRLKAVSHLEVAAGGFKFGLKLDQLGKPEGTTLAQAIVELVDQARANVVLIIDEVQHTLGTQQGSDLLFALKAAREAVNKRPDTPGRFIFIGTGSHRAQVQELVVRGNQAFQGAESREFPVLGQDYVKFMLDQSGPQLQDMAPSLPAAYSAFQQLGCKPEELTKALQTLRAADGSIPADKQLPIIVKTLMVSAGDIELARLEQLGSLAGEVFSRICAAEDSAKGLYSAKALADYSRALGRDVGATDVQAALLALSDANLVMRKDHGRYEVTDPFVKQARRDQLLLLASDTPGLPTQGDQHGRG